MKDQMSNTKKNGLVPGLRFTEFQDDGEWEKKILGDILTLEYGKARQIDEDETNGNFPVVGSNGIVGYSSKKLTDEATIVIGRKGSAGEVHFIEMPCYPIDTTFYVKLKDDKINLRFLYLLLHNANLKNYKDNSCIPGINRNELYRIHIRIPTIAEQQKIVACLSSIDDLIMAQSKTIDALKIHKKGLMQKLFPKDGENVPELGYGEFKDYKWDFVKLKTLSEVKSSKRVFESDWSDSGIPFYRAREIISLYKGESISPLYISKDLYLKNIKLCGKITAGDILVTGTGYVRPYVVKESDNFYFRDSDIIWIRNISNRILSKYLYYLYQCNFIQSQITRSTGIGTVGHYTIINAKNTIIPFPSLKEQQKIADCLSSLDELIALQTKKLEALKLQKKGLMQKLFPKWEE